MQGISAMPLLLDVLTPSDRSYHSLLLENIDINDKTVVEFDTESFGSKFFSDSWV